MDVSLTTFVDFIARAGTPKLTVVRNWKHRDPYDPKADYWKQMREAIVDVHARSKPLSHLDDTVASAADGRSSNYRQIATAYKKWVRKKTPRWFRPPGTAWSCNGVNVQVNPELGLVIDGQRHVIKLYFKQEALPKNRAVLVLHMMQAASASADKNGTVMCVLNVRRGLLYASGAPEPQHGTQLKGEAAYWASVWTDV